MISRYNVNGKRSMAGQKLPAATDALWPVYSEDWLTSSYPMIGFLRGTQRQTLS